jgi:hypothetical protein
MPHYPGHIQDIGGKTLASGVVPLTGTLNIMVEPVFDSDDASIIDKNPRGRRKAKNVNAPEFKRKLSAHNVLFINNNMIDFEEDSIVGYEIMKVGKHVIAINLEVEEAGPHTWSFPSNDGSQAIQNEKNRIANMIKQL